MDANNFNADEVHALNVYFDGIAAKKEKETVIDRAQFKAALGLKESLFINRMFLMFDTDGDGQINFEEFLSGISMMCEDGDFAEKVQFSFQVYDFDGDGMIARQELTDMLKASLAETELEMTDEELDILVSATLKSTGSSATGSITYDQYMQYAQLNRERFQSAMTVNIKQRIARST